VRIHLLHKTRSHGTKIAYIEQVGEKMVRFASIMTSVYNVAARGGIGVVMRAKRLTAIVVDPRHGSANVAHHEYLQAPQDSTGEAALRQFAWPTGCNGLGRPETSIC